MKVRKGLWSAEDSKAVEKQANDLKLIAEMSQKSLESIWNNQVDEAVWNNFSQKYPIRD